MALQETIDALTELVEGRLPADFDVQTLFEVDLLDEDAVATRVAELRARFAAPEPLEVQRTFYNTHLAPWAGHFFSDLEGAKNSIFYASVGTVGRAFMEIETEAFRMSGA